jgi:hypothetical protein
MSRNLSHNTGSHKAPWFKNFYGNYIRTTHDYFKSSDLNVELLPDPLKDYVNAKKIYNHKNELKTLNEIESQFSIYFDFVNDNMEFIADTTTNTNSTKVVINYSFQNVCNEYKEMKYMHSGLMDDKERRMNIKIDSLFTNSEFDLAFVGIPNGQLGKTAFYVIIENILRNYYKHSYIKDNTIKIKVKIQSDPSNSDDYWRVDIFDSHGEDNPNRDEKLLAKINKYLEGDITKDGTLRQEGWGYIEMKACAAYLINFPMTYINLVPTKLDEKIKLPTGERYNKIIEGNYYDEKGEKMLEPFNPRQAKNLGYRLYLKRAKRVAIFEPLISNQAPSKEQFSVLGKYGINFLSETKLTTKLEHEIVIVNSVTKNKVDANQRRIEIDHLDLRQLKTPKQIELFAWRNYISARFKGGELDFSIVYSGDVKHFSKTVTIAIDDHGRDLNLKDKSFGALDEFLWYLPEENKTKRDTDYFKLSLQNNEDGQLAKLKLIECLNLKVSIFDERIQQETCIAYNNIPGLTLRDIHEFGNVFIPNIVTHDLTSETCINSLEKIIETRFETDDFVIIHFTLFEKMAESRHWDKNLSKEDNLLGYYNYLKSKKNSFENSKDGLNKKFLIFCSGRGRPSTMFKDCYYMHLSTLQSFVVRNISKFSLINALKSLRKYEKDHSHI